MASTIIHHCEEVIRIIWQSTLKKGLAKFDGLLLRLKLTAMTSIVLSILSSCSTYSSKFICSNAKGLNCEMMHSVDQKITTGEIEKFYICGNKKCLKEKL